MTPNPEPAHLDAGGHSEWWHAERARIPPEQWPLPDCPRNSRCVDELVGCSVFNVYRCTTCGYEEWL
jgi:hypothetical protein